MRANDLPADLAAALVTLSERDVASIFAIEAIALERVKQITEDGWAPEHDDTEHAPGDLAAAAAAYARAPHTHRRRDAPKPRYWPWHADWWKPGSKHRNCVKAGALIVAELAKH